MYCHRRIEDIGIVAAKENGSAKFRQSAMFMTNLAWLNSPVSRSGCEYIEYVACSYSSVEVIFWLKYGIITIQNWMNIIGNIF